MPGGQHRLGAATGQAQRDGTVGARRKCVGALGDHHRPLVSVLGSDARRDLGGAGAYRVRTGNARLGRVFHEHEPLGESDHRRHRHRHRTALAGFVAGCVGSGHFAGEAVALVRALHQVAHRGGAADRAAFEQPLVAERRRQRPPGLHRQHPFTGPRAVRAREHVAHQGRPRDRRSGQVVRGGGQHPDVDAGGRVAFADGHGVCAPLRGLAVVVLGYVFRDKRRRLFVFLVFRFVVFPGVLDVVDSAGEAADRVFAFGVGFRGAPAMFRAVSGDSDFFKPGVGVGVGDGAADLAAFAQLHCRDCLFYAFAEHDRYCPLEVFAS